MARPRKTTRRKAARKRQPKRILNVNPSPKTEEDWTFQTAAEADMVAAAPRDPLVEGPAHDVVEGRRPGLDRLLRRLGVRRLGPALALRQGRTPGHERPAVAALRLDGLQGDRPVLRPVRRRSSRRRGRASSPRSTSRASSGSSATRPCPSPRAGSTAGQANTFYAVAAQLKILAYFNLGTNLTNWRIWLATKGPILTRLNVDDTWYDATANAGNLDEYMPDTGRGGHAVALVGYRPDRFIVRNSWGTSWGDGGFAYASLAYAQEAFTEAYGVEV